MEKIFQFLFLVLIRHTPENWGGVRSFFVRKYVKKAGEGLSIGRKCFIHKNTEIGEGSGVGYACVINNGVTMGKNIMMGPEVLIYTQNHNTSYVDVPMCKQGMQEMRPVIIEDDVWIGARAVILPGVTIGHGSVVGACAVVTKDVPPYSIYVGNPGRVVKIRTNKEK